jgi:hypothetical protein
MLWSVAWNESSYRLAVCPKLKNLANAPLKGDRSCAFAQKIVVALQRLTQMW